MRTPRTAGEAPGEAPKIATQRARVWLAKARLRPTRQRLALAEFLVGDGQDRHVTAESLFDAARENGAPVALATVYNTLRAFTRAGLMNEITIDGNRSCFDTNVADHAHFHFDDGRIGDASHEPVTLNNLPDAPEGHEIARVDVVIRLRAKARKP